LHHKLHILSELVRRPYTLLSDGVNSAFVSAADT